MAMIKDGDFVELSYTGRINESVFDTTDELEAKKLGIHMPGRPYGAIGICVGQQHVIKGLDEWLIGKEPGKAYPKVMVPAEKAFGKKHADLIKLVPKTKFTKQRINPQPGMQLNIDGTMAFVKSISGGRVMVDFNHPLAGKDVNYDVKITRTITDAAEKVRAILRMELNIKDEGYTLEMKDAKGTIIFKKGAEIPDAMRDVLADRIKQLTGMEITFGGE